MASRRQTPETRQKISAWAKANPRGCIGTRVAKPPGPCSVCGEEKPLNKKYRKTCGKKKCQYAGRGGFRQAAHSYGIKGRYKNIPCDSLWELAFLVYHLDHGSNISRNRTSWSYQHPNGSTRRFYPDFNIDGTIYEIKGRRTEIDDAKLAAVKSIILMQGAELQPMFDYVKAAYHVTGSSLAKLYDGKLNATIKCKHCSIDIIDDGRRSCCSKSCATSYTRSLKSWGKTKVIRKCEECSVETKNAKFCSLSCSRRHLNLRAASYQ